VGYQYRMHALYLDDVLGGRDVGSEEARFRRILIALCERDKPTRVRWATRTRELEAAGVPNAYHTYSRVVIVRNAWWLDAALASRANMKIYFAPSNIEVHRYAATWCYDQQAHDFIGQHLAALPPIDCRWYEDAVDMRAAYPDTWRDEFLRAHGVAEDVAAVLRLEVDPRYPSRQAKCGRWIEEMRAVNRRRGNNALPASRATYMRLVESLGRSGRLAAARPVEVMRLPRAGAVPRQATLASCEALDRGESLPPPPPSSGARAAFAAPITGVPAPMPAANGTMPAGRMTDDSLPWEEPETARTQDEGDDGE
jgi:hypothetical protein